MEKKSPTFHFTPWPLMASTEEGKDQMRTIIRGRLAEFGGDVSKVAESMGLKQRSLYIYMDRLGMTEEAKAERRAAAERLFSQAMLRAALGADTIRKTQELARAKGLPAVRKAKSRKD